MPSLIIFLLVVFFGSVTKVAAQATIVRIADSAVLAAPGATIDFPAVDVRLISEMALLGKTTGIGVNIFVKFSTVPGVFGDSVPGVAINGEGGCLLDPVVGVHCGATPLPFTVAGPFMLIRAVYPVCTLPGGSCPAQTLTLDAFMLKHDRGPRGGR